MAHQHADSSEVAYLRLQDPDTVVKKRNRVAQRVHRESRFTESRSGPKPFVEHPGKRAAAANGNQASISGAIGSLDPQSSTDMEFDPIPGAFCSTGESDIRYISSPISCFSCRHLEITELT
jgi:hypothetical protein